MSPEHGPAQRPGKAAAPGADQQQQQQAAEMARPADMPPPGSSSASAPPVAMRSLPVGPGAASPTVDCQPAAPPSGGLLAPDRPRPITPDPTPAQAGATPGAAHAAAASPAATRSATAVARAAAVAPEGQQAGILWPRIHAFVCCVDSSPLLQSALCSLVLEEGPADEAALAGGEAPAAAAPLPPGAALQLALAQALALFLRAGYEEASEDALLAVLWVLESYGSCWRSPASVCLSSYVKHLARFSTDLVVRLTEDWPTSFRRMRKAVVDAQRELLARLDWRVRLDMHADVRPCHLWLFQAPEAWRQLAHRLGVAPPPEGRPAQPLIQAPPPGAWAVWATHMLGVCGLVERQAEAAAGPVQRPKVPARCDSLASPSGRPTPSPKRQRLQL